MNKYSRSCLVVAGEIKTSNQFLELHSAKITTSDVKVIRGKDDILITKHCTLSQDTKNKICLSSGIRDLEYGADLMKTLPN